MDGQKPTSQASLPAYWSRGSVYADHLLPATQLIQEFSSQAGSKMLNWANQNLGLKKLIWHT